MAALAAGIKGTGVGLTIVSRVVEAHSGELRIDSRVGEGTRFWVTLPAEISSSEKFRYWATGRVKV